MKKFLLKIKNKLIMTGSAVVSGGVLAVAVSAEEGTGTNSLESMINTAGSTLTAEFTVLVHTLVPVLIGIGVIGLGLYACIFLFKTAKKFFTKAAA